MPNDLAAPLPYLEVAAYLEAEGVAGGEAAWPLIRGAMPASPDAVLAIFPAGGAAPEGKYDLRHPFVQLRARGEVDEQTPPYLKLEEALATLRAAAGVVMGAGLYVHFVPQSEVLALGQDQNRRFEFAVTLRAAREPAP